MKYIAGGIVAAAAIIGIVIWLRGAPDSPVIEPGLPPAVTAPETGAPQAMTEQDQPKAPETETKHTAITTKSGMKIETTKEGTGDEIVNGKTAVMSYTGTLPDGTVFDATSKHGGTPFEFKLGAGEVIKGWDEGILGMKVGEERTLVIPSELGYGANGYPPVIPGGATLTFTVKLLGIK